MNLKTILLVAGLVIGAIAGWITAPKAVDIQVGPLTRQVQNGGGEGGNITATGNDGQIQVQVGNPSPLSDRNTRTAIFAVVGAIIGFGAGFFAERRKA
ncbi:MAG: hypothetical protein NUV72_00085 [Bauldia sp.]|nr:hypothetical protein [Bauldia sp.]